MRYKIVQSKRYLKRAAKFFKKHPDLLPKYQKVLEQLEVDPHYPSLRLHKLKGELNEYYSVSIDRSYRIVIDLIITDKEIILLDIGSHDEVY
jgi:addiction module RelE/StbE family toxin